MKKSGYIKNYLHFITEQALGIDPMTGEEQKPAPKKDKPFKFLFLDDVDTATNKLKKYPDGTHEFNFSTYSVFPKDLDDWLKKNIVTTDKNKLTQAEVELRQNNILKILSGDKVNISKEDIPFIDKLKSAVSTDIFGRREPDTHVVFTKNSLPTTEQVDVTFIKYKK